MPLDPGGSCASECRAREGSAGLRWSLSINNIETAFEAIGMVGIVLEKHMEWKRRVNASMGG